jgi:DNA-binding CsgD family transcriptional regulator
VSAVGAGVAADAAERARDLGDEEAARAAVARANALLERVEAAAAGERPVERAWLRTAQADAARAAGADDPERWAVAAAAWDALGRPYQAALARAREAEALVRRGEREAAERAAREAADTAAELGASWLLGEVRGLAARARLRVDGTPQADGAEAGEGADGPAAEDPFGLTPRERQVLALVAEGRTNREIGAALFMAEKTASVHVSRILAKLDVRSRTEAAGVAHRLGLDAPPGAVAAPAGGS